MSNNKFESLLELLINEENDKAEALFHEIVVEKSRDIYEGLAEEPVKEETKEEAKDEVKETEASEDQVDETTDEAKDEDVKETSDETKSEESLEEVEIEDEATESEKSEEESIEEVGGDATDELVKDISADEENTPEMDMDGDKAADDMEKDMDMDGDKDDEDMEDRVVDLEDALDELKAEFEAMMGDKKDDMDKDDMDKEDESLEMPAETAEEIPMEAAHKDKDKDMKKEAMHDKKKDMKKEAMHGKDKKKMDEYKISKSANNSDMSDKSAKSPIGTTNKPLNSANAKSLNQGQADSGDRPAPTAQKMAGEFANSPGKDKAAAMKPMKANTADGSEKSAKSPIPGK